MSIFLDQAFISRIHRYRLLGDVSDLCSLSWLFISTGAIFDARDGGNLQPLCATLPTSLRTLIIFDYNGVGIRGDCGTSNGKLMAELTKLMEDETFSQLEMIAFNMRHTGEEVYPHTPDGWVRGTVDGSELSRDIRDLQNAHIFKGSTCHCFRRIGVAME